MELQQSDRAKASGDDDDQRAEKENGVHCVLLPDG